MVLDLEKLQLVLPQLIEYVHKTFVSVQVVLHQPVLFVLNMAPINVHLVLMKNTKLVTLALNVVLPADLELV